MEQELAILARIDKNDINYFDGIVKAAGSLTNEADKQMDETKGLASQMDNSIKQLKMDNEDALEAIFELETITDKEDREEAYMDFEEMFAAEFRETI